MATGESLRKFDAAHTAAISAIRFSKDNSNLLTASNDYTVKWVQNSL